MSNLLLKSPYDGSLLSFAITTRKPDEVIFDILVKTGQFTGRASASTYHSGSPAAMFRAMANEWQGWSGEKRWEDLEGRVMFVATCDSTGHVRLQVGLQGEDYESSLHAILQFEAGQLEAMARTSSYFLESLDMSDSN